MKQISKSLTLIAAVATLAFARTASAEVFTATLSGTVSGGGDYTGVFGTAGRNLIGLPISTVLTYDTGRGTTATRANAVSLTGGSSVGASPFLVSTRVTIDGVSFDLLGGTSEELTLRASAYYPGTGQGLIYGTSDYQAYVPNPYVPGGAPALQARQILSFNLSAPGVVANLTQPFVTVPSSGLVSIGLIAHDYSLANTIVMRADPIFTPTQAVFATAVPEPHAWALMILGVGFVGAWKRRRGIGADTSLCSA